MQEHLESEVERRSANSMPAKSRCDKPHLPTIGKWASQFAINSIQFHATEVGHQARTGAFDEAKVGRNSVFHWWLRVRDPEKSHMGLWVKVQ
jgi:hypothetical protein